MVWTREGTVAHLALERFLAGMFPEMTCQFVRARKSPVTTLPGAVIWFFTLKYKKGIQESISEVLVLAYSLCSQFHSNVVVSGSFGWHYAFRRNFLVLPMRFSKKNSFLKFIVLWTIFIWVQQGKRWQATLFSIFVQSFLIPSMSPTWKDSVFNILFCNVKIALLTHWRINRTHKST